MDNLADINDFVRKGCLAECSTTILQMYKIPHKDVANADQPDYKDLTCFQIHAE